MRSDKKIAVRIDAHCHFWQLSRGDYDWLDGDDEALAPIRRDFTPEDIEPLASAARIESRVLVQAAPTLNETRYLLSLAAKDSFALGVVGWVDLMDANCVATLEELAADPLFLGIRPTLQDRLGTDRIVTHPIPEVLDALERLKLRFDALVMTRHLPALLTFLDSISDLPVIIDHAAKPALGEDSHHPLNIAWTRDMRRLARETQSYVKLSGLLTEMPAHLRGTPQEAARNLQPTVSHLVDEFGPQRILWGSDWPVVTLAAPFTFWDTVTDILLAELHADERAYILGGNATSFYA